METSGLEWARQFSTIAAELKQLHGTNAVLHRIAQLATEVAACPWAAIARATDRRPVVAATSDPAAAELIGEIQATAGGGPTWHAVQSGQAIYVADLATDTRWPEHVRELLAHTPVRSIAAFPLELSERRLGALTLYGDRARAFSDHVLDVASVYAEHAAIALDTDRTRTRAENLEIALQTSREIGIAIGILVERHRLTAEQAFDMLRAASQRTHRKLRDIAAQLTLTGELEIGVGLGATAVQRELSD